MITTRYILRAVRDGRLQIVGAGSFAAMEAAARLHDNFFVSIEPAP